MVILQAILEELEKHPFYGYRKIALALKDLYVTRKQIRRIMKKAGLQAIYPKKRLSKPIKWHIKYPYLLRNKKIWLPNQVWATDITYIKLKGGTVYLAAIIDLYSRKILSWRISNTMDASFCIEALEDAIKEYGVPAIFNTDQGSQFTSDAFIDVLNKHLIAISMDGVKRFVDNIYVERFWRSLKYEEIYLNEYESVTMLKEGIRKYVIFFNTERFHQSLDYETPDEKYYNKFKLEKNKRAA
jgi:putative transposase